MRRKSPVSAKAGMGDFFMLYGDLYGYISAIYKKTSAIYRLYFDILRIILYNMRNKEI